MMEVSERVDTVDELQLLRRELTAQANNNLAFRKCEKDYVFIELQDIERGLPLSDFEKSLSDADDEEDEEDYDEDAFHEAIIETVYTFSAERRRYLTSQKVEKAWVRFDLSLVMRLHGAAIPGYIAEEAIGLPAEEAARELGEVIAEHRLTYKIYTHDNSIKSQEARAYLDCDHDPISEVTSDTEKELVYVNNVDYDDEDVVEDEVDIDQYLSSDFRTRYQHETIVLTDADAAVEAWSVLYQVEQTMETDEKLRRVREARALLRTVSQAIREMAGK